MMSVFKKYDYWSILESLDTMTEYDYNGNVNDSIYYDFYQEQITELFHIARGKGTHDRLGIS